MNNNICKKKINKGVKLFIISLLALMLFIAFFFIYAIATDYQPAEKEIVFNNKIKDTIKQQKFSILSWNIGYCGLGENMDFFYDGGKKVRASKKETINNLKNIINFISERDSIDFVLLQEVDTLSKRSYFINELDSLKTKLKNYFGVFALNYNVKYVPIPLFSPLGKVKSGLVILSKIKPNISIRYSFPENYPMPKKIFMLDRCFLVNKYKLKNGKSLIVINTHNSAYDNGTLKQGQMLFLKKYIINEYEKGNYLIIGGDWNQLPPNVSENKIETKNVIIKNIKKNFLPKSWTWVFDKNTSTNRSLETKYISGKSKTSILDFFLISPNINNLNVKTINLHFKKSDHQPVIATFDFKI